MTQCFANASPRLQYAYVDAATVADSEPHAGRLPLLYQLYRELSAEQLGLGRRVRFDLYRLANWLTTQNVDQMEGDDDARKKLVRLLRERRDNGGTGQSIPAATEVAPHWTTKLALLLFGMLWPVSRFWLWAGGRVPGLGRQARWFMRQPFMPPKQQRRFLEFAYRLTAGRTHREDPREIDKLLVHAFLEDLRHAYRRRPWKLRPWRRTAYTTVLLDNVTVDNGGWQLLDLLNEVRNETGELDPLLVVAASTDPPPRWPTGRDIPEAAEAAFALDEWRANLSRQRQIQAHAGWYLLLELPHPVPSRELPVEDRRAFDRLPDYRARRPPLFARRPVVSLVGMGLLLAMVPPAYPYVTTGCLPFRLDGVSVRPVAITVDGHTSQQCVGYSDSTWQVFGTDRRLRAAQAKVFEQNLIAEQLQEDNPGRPLISLVYFAGLTHSDADSHADSDTAQAEEIEGLLLRQRQQNVSNKSEPVLRIIIANGGNKMKAAVEVTRDLLVSLAESDLTVLGVIGLDRSVEETGYSIAILGSHGIPVVATNLTSNGLETISPLYFQIVPSNITQARLVAEFARREGATRVTIYHPAASGNRDEIEDLFVRTLVPSLKEALGPLAAGPITWDAGQDPDLPPLCGDNTDRSGEIVFYAGRHDNFRQFLMDITRGCYDKNKLPTILADDAISRFVANKSERRHDELAGITVLYVSKGSLVVLAGKECAKGKPSKTVSGSTSLDTFCAGYHKLHTELQQSVLAWPGERLGIVYDTAGLFLAAVRHNRSRNLDAVRGNRARANDEPFRYAPDRAAIAQELREIEFRGATGTVRFSSSRVAEDKNLAILEIDDIYDLAASPRCRYVIGDLYHPDQPRQENGCPRAEDGQTG